VKLAFVGGLLVIILQIFVMLIIGGWIAKCQLDVMQKKNDRMKIISEVFNNIKLIKMNAWEDFFYRKLDDKRVLEVNA
jgi:ABC-type bacteriocin/lantibiotic exporter with double-glycine peptidase domain